MKRTMEQKGILYLLQKSGWHTLEAQRLSAQGALLKPKYFKHIAHSQSTKPPLKEHHTVMKHT